jgi:hypothetical protein
MWYIGCKNHIYSNLHLSLNESIKIKRLENTLNNVLITNDENMWGRFFNGREFVMYTKVTMFEEIPNKLNEYFYDNNKFCLIDDKLVCKTVGRYKAIIDQKTWILDVIFPNCYDEEMKIEYIENKNGVFRNWKYDLSDANLSDFVMEKINELSYDNRDIITIIRHLMSEFSSEHSENALICGKWSSDYSDGLSPSAWKSSSHVFREWGINKKPIKYGQCWVFSECFTTVMRFLNIPCRTIYAENSHINPSLNCSIDFSEHQLSNKSEITDNNKYDVLNVNSFLNLENQNCIVDSCDTKDETDFDKCVIYDGDDSYWNIHYWNEIYIPRIENNQFIFSWECADVTPYIKSSDEPCNNYKILGPCKIENILNGIDEIFDFKYLNASINSPFRIWCKKTIIENGDIVSLPYLKSMIYPFYPEQSIYANKKIKLLLDKKVKLLHRTTDVTNNYKMSFERIYEYIHQNNPILFDILNGQLIIQSNIISSDIYYVQQIVLNDKSIVIDIRRQNCLLQNIELIQLNKSSKIISFLITKGSEFWCQIIKILN